MKKILIIIFFISVIFCSLGCEINDKTKDITEVSIDKNINEKYEVNRITKLSKELETSILTAYKKTNKADKLYQLYIDDCYLFTDDLCFFFAHGLYNTYFYYISEEVADCKFIYPNSNNLLVLHKDEVLSVTKAFEKGIINEARVKVLFELYKNQYVDLYNNEVMALDYNLLLKIKNEYATKHGVVESEKINVSNYLGTYDEAVVLFISHGVYFQELTTEIVDGIEFTYSNSIKLSVYKNGEFYSLETAFESRLLTHNELLKISQLLNN